MVFRCCIDLLCGSLSACWIALSLARSQALAQRICTVYIQLCILHISTASSCFLLMLGFSCIKLIRINISLGFWSVPFYSGVFYRHHAI